MSYAPLDQTETRDQQTFEALLWALSYPGRARALPASGIDAFMAIGRALIDLETSYGSPDADLMERLAATGGRASGSDAARYQFYPTLRDMDLIHLRRAPVGSHLYPDEGATLIIGCRIGSGQRMVWSGPGINGSTAIELDALPPAFWRLRADAIRYPLGWDVLFVAGDQVIGLPRTTHVEVR